MLPGETSKEWEGQERKLREHVISENVRAVQLDSQRSSGCRVQRLSLSRSKGAGPFRTNILQLYWSLGDVNSQAYFIKAKLPVA